MPRRSRRRPSPPSRAKAPARRRTKPFWSPLKRPRVKKIGKFLLILAFWGFIFGVIGVFALSAGLPDIHKAVDLENRPAIIMRDRKGVEFARSGAGQGDILRLKDISPHLVNAVIATEDRRFYSHLGIDPIGLARAIVNNVRHSGASQGGSTITQQLAKNLFLSPERTLKRKVKEALLALYLERRYSKDEILATYLNRAYFGGGAYGVDSAARIYFNTSARKLTLEQSAMLAGLLKAPTRYSPNNDPELTKQRTRVVLAAMVDAGYLRPGAEKTPLPTMPKKDYDAAGSTDMRYFSDWIAGQIEAYIGAPTQDLVVDTTLDAASQAYAARKLREVLDKQGKALRASQGAVVVMQPDGAIVTMAGGRDYGESQYNRAVAALRQPGSSFKPFVYITALENGYTPQTLVTDAPLRIGKYAPQNYDGKYRGTIPLRDAVANSLNTVAVRVAQDVGVSKIIRTAQRMGISEALTNDLSLALGASDVHILSMTSAYATLANGGRAAEPYGIRMIRTTGGKVLYQHRQAVHPQVLSPNIVAEATYLLQGVVQYGTGQRALIDRPVAGKTGTSSDYRDAWFLGYSADYATCVWVGNDNNTPMKKVTGGMLPAQIWHDVMLNAEQGLPARALAIYGGAAQDAVYGQPGEIPTEDAAPAPPAEGGNVFENLLDSILGGGREQPANNETINWD